MQEYEKIIQTAKNYVNSVKQLTRIFVMFTGITPSEYLRWAKLTKAVYDLIYSNISIFDIALKYGYECVQLRTATLYKIIKSSCQTMDSTRLNPACWWFDRPPISR